MRPAIGRITVVLLCIAALFGMVYMDRNMEEAEGEAVLSFYVGEEIVNAWKNGETYYLFLPSYAEISKVMLTSYCAEFEVLESELLLKQGDLLQTLEPEIMYSCRQTKTQELFSFCILRSQNLPSIFIETDSGSLAKINTDKTVEENGKLRVVSEKGERLYRGGISGIKARGNYSFSNYAKKSYTLTLKEEASLLSLGAGKKYVLVSNASDPTLMRNDIARKIEAELQPEYDNIGCFLDLYVNGEYLGNYYLCESIAIGTERINITNLQQQMDRLYQKSNYESYAAYETNTKKGKQFPNNPTDITGGYLLEREFKDRYKLEYAENASGFVTKGEEYFVVKSPSYCSAEQISYLEQYFNEAEEAIFAMDGVHTKTQRAYWEYIDIDSFAKKYLVEEVIKNYDGGISSAYYYKDVDSIDPRIKAAPVWDCDMSLGSYLEWMEYYHQDASGLTKLASREHASTWYAALYEKKEFYQRVCQLYQESVSSYMEQLANVRIDALDAFLLASATMNEIRWAEDFSKYPDYHTREESITVLKAFLMERKEFLDQEWDR